MTKEYHCDLEENWNGKWKEILEKEDGSIDVEQLKKELADFQDLIDKHIDFVAYATGSRLSKATYKLSSLKQAHDDYIEELLEDARKDAVEDYKTLMGIDDDRDDELLEDEEEDVPDVADILSNPDLLDSDREDDDY